jgi:methyltransferase (TIGR00027 family)
MSEYGSPMDADEPLIRNVSDTALWVAAYRASESERRRPLFRDPYARRLASDRGFEIAANVRSRLARAGARVNVVLRTAVIDELILHAVRIRGFDTVLNLAAGLDTRPYRMDLPSGLRWIEVDLPDLLDYKERVLGGEAPRCRLERVRLDLAEREARVALFERVARESGRVLVVSEGLLAYLQPEEVGALADDLHRETGFAEWVADFAAHHIIEAGSAADGLADRARTVFAPAEGSGFFRPHGWVGAELIDLTDEIPRLGRGPVRTWALRLLVGALPEAKHRPRVMGVARLERLAGSVAEPVGAARQRVTVDTQAPGP